MPRPPSTRHTEREAKLRPPAGFELADLVDVVAGTAARVLPNLDLVATYLDTHALTLARSGITLRHRRGEGPDRWTLKLPSGSGGRALVRQEVDIEAPMLPRPPEISRILAVHLRGRRLAPCAVIATVRSRVAIEAADGTVLVEVAHDRVTATHGSQLLGSWEEIEVEAVDPGQGPAALKATVRGLEEFGCTRAAPMPKLVRALGDPALAPPEVVVPDLPRHPRAHDALERALARSVSQIMDADPKVRVGGDPEDLHRLRVAVRRLRSDLKTFRRFLDHDRVDPLMGELRWVADETNELRDLDVLRGWLRAHSTTLPAADQSGLAGLAARCDEQRADRARRFALVLDSARYLTLVHDLVSLLETPLQVSKRQDTDARRRLARQVRKRWDALAEKVDTLEADQTDAALHQARIAAKRCRAAVEAMAPISDPAVGRLARSLAELQDVLGAAHDAAVIEAWLRTASDTSDAFVAGELAAAARADAQQQQGRWPEVWAKVERRRHLVART